MRLYRARGVDPASTIRCVCTDKKEMVGVVGTIADLLDANLLKITPGKEMYSRDTYMCIPADRTFTFLGVGATAKEAIQDAVLPKK